MRDEPQPDQLSEANEADLVAAIAHGDDAAMAEILRRHRPPILAFARRLAGDARAEDVCQDVFLRLWQRPDRFDPQRGALRAFLLALTHGRALDVTRSDTARQRREGRDAAAARPSADPETTVVARSVATDLHAALAALPDVERRPVELAYFGGHSYRTVATMLGEPEGTVKSRIRSGLTRLRRELTALQTAG